MEASEIPLSLSMNDVKNSLIDSDSVTSWELVQKLLVLHPGYASGLGGKLRDTSGPKDGDRLPIQDWIARAYDIYDPAVIDMMDGKLTIWALTRVDPVLREYLDSSNFIKPLEEEIKRDKGALERLVRDSSILEPTAGWLTPQEQQNRST